METKTSSAAPVPTTTAPVGWVFIPPLAADQYAEVFDDGSYCIREVAHRSWG